MSPISPTKIWTMALSITAVALVTMVVVVVASAAQSKVDAAALYKTHCQLCHGANGNSPMKNASFTDGTWLHGSSPAEVQASIRNGVKGTVMLGFAGKLKPEEIEALARHVRSFDKTLK